MSLEPGNADSDKNMIPWQEMVRLEGIVEELNKKLVNLANKLEEHLNERDAHNPGVMRRK